MARSSPGKRNGNGAPLGFEAQLWAAADKLRGNMEPSDYKHVALGLIFLKYISDAFEAKRADLLQDELADTDVLLVSVSVDPTNDSPERLRTYGGRFDADPERWWFLTGEESEVYKLITGSFKLAVDAADEGRPHLITHDSRLSAVDREGKVRGWYHHEDDRDLLVERMRYLAGE